MTRYLRLLLPALVLAGGSSVWGQTADSAGSMPASEISYPRASSSRPFTATEPYIIKVMGVDVVVPLYRASRSHDFSGSVPFINPVTGVADPGTIQAWDPVLSTSRSLLGKDMTNAGFPGRVEKRNGLTMVRYNAGDGITAGKSRTQLSSYAIPPRTHVRWELEVAFGADDSENTWFLTPPMASRVLFWQVKSPAGLNPSMQAVVDTDPNDPTRSLAISFFRKGGRANEFLLVGRVQAIPRNTLIPIAIEAFLDEREVLDGGKGRVKIWVQGLPVGDAVGPTLSWGPGEHRWYMNMYLYSESEPYTHTRASFWKTARMFVYP